MTTTLTSRQFNQETSRAKRAATDGPVFITQRGRRSHVLLSIEEYERLLDHEPNIVDQLALEGADEIDFEPARLSNTFLEKVDLS